MFGQLYEAPTLNYTGVALILGLNMLAIFFYKQLNEYYKSRTQPAVRFRDELKSSLPPVTPGPAGPANGPR